MQYMARVLIIDDEEDLLTPLGSLLKKSGFEVATLSRASTTFMTVDVFKPDIILLDIKLSDYDGRDICFQLKSNNRTKRVKILLCSAHITRKDEYVEYGADGFIGKPFEYKDLVKKINYHLKSED